MEPRKAAALAGLGVEFGGCSSKPVADASITLLPPGGGGPIGPSLVVDAALIELEKNRNKLQRSGRRQRHFFVWIDGSAFLTWLGFDSELPATIPDLGAEARPAAGSAQWCIDRVLTTKSWSGQGTPARPRPRRETRAGAGRRSPAGRCWRGLERSWPGLGRSRSPRPVMAAQPERQVTGPQPTSRI